jgi:hypothetical protein
MFGACNTCKLSKLHLLFQVISHFLEVRPEFFLIQQFVVCNEQCAMWNHMHHGYKRHLCCWKVGGVDGPPTCENVTTNDSTINSGPRNQKFIGKWNITTYHYKSSSCTFETTPLKFHLLGFYVMNDDLHMDFEILQMLWCIICTLKKVSRNFLFWRKAW